MPTYAQLEQEIWWGLEETPDSLRELAVSLRIHFSVGPDDIGSKGDNNHLRGYHRSRAWIQNSNWCTNRSYSVSRTPGDRAGGNSNWVTGMDVGGMSPSELHAMCRRVDAAIRAGHLEKITEWYGTFDGVTVTGYDNISNVHAVSDSSHLFHLHLSFDRGRANEDHTDIFDILTGDDMTPDEVRAAAAGGVADALGHIAHRDSGWTATADAFNLAIKNAGAVCPAETTVVGLTEDQIRAIVREELDKSRLTGA